MKFTDILRNDDTDSATDEHSALGTKKHSVLDEEIVQSPEDLLRAAGFKIKLVTSTSFGTQIDLAKHYDPVEITDVLSEFKIKIKGQSIFIVE
jgi:hypothetical protein